jgi:uncharacterized protein (DUF433 family)
MVAPIGATSARDRGVWCIKGTCVPVQAIARRRQKEDESAAG